MHYIISLGNQEEEGRIQIWQKTRRCRNCRGIRQERWVVCKSDISRGTIFRSVCWT